jgi:hypothetical protein
VQSREKWLAEDKAGGPASKRARTEWGPGTDLEDEDENEKENEDEQA